MCHEEMFLYVKKVLEEGNAIRSTNFNFRNRFEHIKRVYKWCLRLMEDNLNVNKEVVLVAAIFHDVGYCKGKEKHEEESTRIFLEYAKEHQFEENFILKTAKVIASHSNKELLKDNKTSKELILLLEADLLDEEGALGIVWDLMGEGANHPSSFEEGLECLWKHSAHILDQEYMVTPLAKKYWKEKQDFVNQFIETLKADLFIK